MRKLFPIIFFLMLFPIAFAMQGNMPLLAVRQTDGGYEGSTAELILEIKEGTGRVFVDTFPLSKLDTQISMRFAKEMACDFLEKDCGSYDFIYTIRANSPIIGGPSAGAAATIMTVAVLSGININDKVGITGTINSGWLIGPVGGLKEKIEAGAKSGLKKILIPEGETKSINVSDNMSVSIVEFGNSVGVEVVEVSDLNSALEMYTGKTFYKYDKDISVNVNYTETMRGLAVTLCDRNKDLKKGVVIDNNLSELNNIYQEALNFSNKGEESFDKRKYYSAASYCFGSNVKFNQIFLEMKNFSDIKYEMLFEELRNKISTFDNEIEKRKIATITDLESYMVVKERLLEAMKFINISSNMSYTYTYAYANERLLSAYSWAEFFKNKGKRLELNEISLRDTCRQRVAEAEERIQYASLYVPFRLNSPREELDRAYEDFNNGEYALCLFKASKSKAESNIVLNTLGVESDFIPKLIENKLNAATRVIVKAEQKDIFPILGYSYFEYANSLKESDKFSALLYAEYALELSNLDIYFKEKKPIELPEVDMSKVVLVLIGISLGVLIGILVGIGIGKKERIKRRKD